MAKSQFKDGVGERGQRDIEGGATGSNNAGAPDEGIPSGNYEAAGTSFDFLKLVQSAETQNEQFLAAIQRQSWQQTIRAFRNQHLVGSKYGTAPYRNRSKIFRPKIRTAVRKNLAAAASAMFSTSDVVQIKAEYDSNPVKNASAAVLHQIANYRLDRTSVKGGIPWFLMAMSANLDAQLTGVCASKQFWEREVSIETHDIEVEEEYEEPVIDEETGYPMFGLDGQQMTQVKTRIRQDTEEVEHVIKDRPMVMTMPPEHVMIDPAAPWYDPAQLSPYLIGKFPMAIEDAMMMMQNPGRSGTQWLELTEAELKQAASDYQTKSVRVERSGGVDRFDAGSSRDDNRIVWFYECFFRVGGVDYTFWTVGTRFYASVVRTTREAYPEQLGQRPYTYGYGQIESHNLAPMSMAESLMPLQIEANDLANLNLDTKKQSLSPIAVVRQGTVFDWKQLQHRGAADSTVIVKNVDDLRFETTPANSNAYQEMNLLNVDMDDLSGSFAGSSVQANRQLNETVGGMRLLSGSANAVTEFDLRVWVETWVEPTLRQAVRCMQYYEDDDLIFEIAGARAKMFERYGVDEITDQDLEAEVSVSVNVGIGSSDPMQKLMKFGQAMQVIAQAAPFFDRPRKLNGEEFIKEVMGDAGYNDGMRFFVDEEEGGEQEQDPEVQKAMMDAQVKTELEKMKGELAERLQQMKSQTQLEDTNLKGRFDVIGQLISELGQESRAAASGEVTRAVTETRSLADLFKTNLSNRAAAERQGGQRERVAA